MWAVLSRQASISACLTGFTVARIYCNHKSRAAFSSVFDGFFTSVEKATGSPLRFKAFDPAGNILSIHLDMEAAQMQGLGDALLRINNPAVSGIDERNPEILVQHVLKACSIHFERYELTCSYCYFTESPSEARRNLFPQLVYMTSSG